MTAAISTTWSTDGIADEILDVFNKKRTGLLNNVFRICKYKPVATVESNGHGSLQPFIIGERICRERLLPDTFKRYEKQKLMNENEYVTMNDAVTNEEVTNLNNEEVIMQEHFILHLWTFKTPFFFKTIVYNDYE